MSSRLLFNAASDMNSPTGLGYVMVPSPTSRAAPASLASAPGAAVACLASHLPVASVAKFASHHGGQQVGQQAQKVREVCEVWGSGFQDKARDAVDQAPLMGHQAEHMMTDVEDMARLVGSRDVAEVHFLGQKLIPDADNATIVIVFTRGEPLGALKTKDIVDDPLKKAHDIFVRQHNHASRETVKEGLDSLDIDHVTLGHYQKVVRRKLLSLFQKSGFKVTTFPSIDGDEIFAKIFLDPKGEVIKDLAQRFSYRMPFKAEAYNKVEAHGIYQGHQPEKRNGKAVLAFGTYKRDLGPEGEPSPFDEFRVVDAIRIVEMQLNSWVSLEQLKRQGIITKYFAVAQHEDVVKLHEEWLVNRRIANCCDFLNLSVATKIFVMPREGTKQGLLRNFFGEEITFFFRWHAFYTQMLCILGVVGAGFHLAQNINIEVRRVAQIVFTCVMVVWATVFNQLFLNRMARARQDWGMQDFESAYLSIDRADYNFELEGRAMQTVKRFLSYVMCFLFCLAFIGVISVCEAKKKEEIETETDGYFRRYGSFVVVMMIKVWSIGWGYIAPLLADMQNHRTQERYNDSLTFMLAFVKVFVTLWNFVYVAFIKNWTSPTCGATMEKVTQRIWNNFTGYAAANRTLADLAMAALKEQRYTYEYVYESNERVCAYGCYPASPYDVTHEGGETNCYQILRYELVTFFFVHIVYTVIFLIWPMMKVKIDMWLELRKVQCMDDEQSPGGGGPAKAYSWLQWQAKCPQYEYASWGGSRVEDFLECAIGYALITCFGILFPSLCLFAFIGNMVEHRLLAYRMTHVTCRPFPRGASGIGSWTQVFEYISNIAVVVNVMLLVSVMYPIKSYDLKYKFAFFIVLEHALLGVRAALDQLIPDCPHDVKRIEDFNNHFIRTMVKFKELHVRPEEQYWKEFARADLGLSPGESLEPNCSDMQGTDWSDSEEGSTSGLTMTDDGEGGGSPWCAGCRRPPSVRPL